MLRDFRHLCSELIEVELLGNECTKNVANLEEIGLRSAVFLAEQPYPRRGRVRLACKSRNLDGVVHSCRKDGVLGFVIEVRLDFHSRGWPQWFTPEHLLTLNAFGLGASPEKTAKDTEKSLRAIRAFCNKNFTASEKGRRETQASVLGLHRAKCA
jgi:hypothetical protein